ncbi:MAG: hypothetical protein FJW20_08480 [Acidimicrobiia bacterium]|nr:hypothetical protein [Acidimicrobiia bacterium]
MGIILEPHVSEDTLERYAMGLLPPPEAARLEEHLLGCHLCQDRLQETDDFIQAFRIAAPRVAEEERLRPQTKPGEWLRAALSGLFAWRPLPVAGALAAIALAVFLAMPDSQRIHPVQTRVLDLRAIRSDASAIARVSDQLTLRLDLEGLQPESGYRVEIAASNGRIVWSGEGKLEGPMLAVSPGTFDEPGFYWVRIVNARQQGSLLREYALEIRN